MSKTKSVEKKTLNAREAVLDNIFENLDLYLTNKKLRNPYNIETKK